MSAAAGSDGLVVLLRLLRRAAAVLVVGGVLAVLAVVAVPSWTDAEAAIVPPSAFRVHAPRPATSSAARARHVTDAPHQRTPQRFPAHHRAARVVATAQLKSIGRHRLHANPAGLAVTERASRSHTMWSVLRDGHDQGATDGLRPDAPARAPPPSTF